MTKILITTDWQELWAESEQKGIFSIQSKGVERTFGWLNWCRRLSKDYERLPETSEIFIYIAMIRIMVRRLA